MYVDWLSFLRDEHQKYVLELLVREGDVIVERVCDECSILYVMCCAPLQEVLGRLFGCKGKDGFQFEPL